MECNHGAVHGLSALLLLSGALYVFVQRRNGPAAYGRYTGQGVLPFLSFTVPARWGWFLQELPAFLVPALMACTTDGSVHGRRLLLCTIIPHYLHRSLVYPFFVCGRPMPLLLVVFAGVFCLVNGFLQSHALLHCSPRGLDWVDSSLSSGLGLFAFGMVMNIHSDHILRSLRRPGETVYRIPRGGLFELVSGANFPAEIVEWFGFAVAVWTLPAFSFAFFTACSIGPRALGHHRFYLEKFPEYPRSRRALIQFILPAVI
uniref:3-oxo-5alpha-steroid 4-dehydrogenase (NADP(+)) n=1 Tax=Neogobius melanostomus TaxID=47308 RepID=A0A8C6WP42_9GOBI